MSPRISFYTHGWSLIDKRFDYRNALDNFALYADEITVAINTSTDGSYEAVESYAREKGYPVKMVATYYDSVGDPFYYGKVVNAALQACTGHFMVQRDMDERWCGDPIVLRALATKLAASPAKAFFIPTIDLYGSVDQYCHAARKWYGHLPGLYRGPVRFGIKENGYIDYDKSSSDELIDADGELVPTVSLLNDLSLPSLQAYAASGMPYSLHLGFVNLHDRAERAVWWREFWSMATAGDPNGHVTDVNELLKRETKPHNLPLWEPQPVSLACRPLNTGPLRGRTKHIAVLDEGHYLPPKETQP